MSETLAVLALTAVIVYLVVAALLTATATLVFLDDRHNKASWHELHTSARIAVTAPLWPWLVARRVIRVVADVVSYAATDGALSAKRRRR